MSHNQTINETPIPFRYAVIPMLVMIIIMGICVIVLKASPHVPLLIGTATYPEIGRASCRERV